MERNLVETSCDQKDVGTLNAQLAHEIIRQCSLLGMKHFCICPGGRNAVFIDCLDACYPENKSYFFHDERAACFFALGLAKKLNEPIGVITTSGSAVAELFPSIMEAYYTSLPILAITADRPKKFRGTGAPQSAEQKNIFGVYCPLSFDVDEIKDFNLALWNLQGPAHVNVCLEESYAHLFLKYPMIAHTNTIKKENKLDKKEECFQELISFLNQSSFPIVIVGGLLAKDKEAVIHFLLYLNLPTYCEAISGIREEERLNKLVIRSPNHIIKFSHCSGYKVDSVLRIGSVPTLRFWRDLEDLKLPVYSISHLPFSGLSEKKVHHVDLSKFLSSYPKSNLQKETYNNYLFMDKTLSDSVQTLLDLEPNSEQTLIHHLSEIIPEDAQIFLGNSLSIRNWDLYATFENKSYEIFANRGVNGIDGQISTFLGLVDSKKSNWAIIGDLTALYDLSAPWVLNQLETKNITIVIINNQGGKIFEPLFKNPKIQNNHSHSFEAFAAMWKMKYIKVIPSELKFLSDHYEPRVIECLPDNEATKRFSEKMR